MVMALVREHRVLGGMGLDGSMKRVPAARGGCCVVFYPVVVSAFHSFREMCTVMRNAAKSEEDVKWHSMQHPGNEHRASEIGQVA